MVRCHLISVLFVILTTLRSIILIFVNVFLKLRVVPCRLSVLLVIVTTPRNIVLIFVNDGSQRLDTLLFACAREPLWRAKRRQLTLGLDMCPGIPMQILSTEGLVPGGGSAKGIGREVSLFLLQDQSVVLEKYVFVHVGHAIQKITPQEARSAGNRCA